MHTVDVAIIGAGAAGIAAARRLASFAARVLVLEARDRAGGRAQTLPFAGFGPLDVGAHWLHAANRNPLVSLARDTGIGIRGTGRDPLVMIDAEPAGWVTRSKIWNAIDQVEDAIVARGEADPGASAQDAVSGGGHWRRVAGHFHGPYSCGLPLAAISAADFARADDDENRFVDGGFGALVARLAANLPVRFSCPALAVQAMPDGVTVETAAGALRAAAVLITLPTTLLAGGHFRIDPPLADATQGAFSDLRHGTYERLVFSLEDSPFGEDADRDVILIEGDKPLYILANVDGTRAHFADLPGEEGAFVAAAGPDAMADLVRERLKRHFGARAAGLTFLHASHWRGDPWTRGAWSVAAPGRADARQILRAPLGERMWYAGEATSLTQWGTVGGAYAEGDRTAVEIAHALQLRPLAA